MGDQQRMRALTMEYALPINLFSEALQAVQEQTRESSSKGEFYLDLPVRFRFGPADTGSLLSPALGRETVYIEVASLVPLTDAVRFFRSLEFRLRDLEGRPHWGKLFWKSPSKRYPAFERFRQIQNRLDPQGKFVNPFMMRVLTGRDMTDLHLPAQ